MKLSGTTTCALALALCVAPATAAAQDDDAASGALEQKAEAVLEAAQEALTPPAPAEPTRELTLLLAELSQLAPALDKADRRVARAILARPDDGDDDRYGDGYDRPEAAESPACDANFCAHWVDTGADAPPLDDDNGEDDGDGVPDVVEQTLDSAQESFAVENTSLGWIEPIGDGSRGGGGSDLTDIYLLETEGQYFGYASPDEGQGPISAKQGYLVLDDDMEEFTSPELTALEALQVTMAHEYNHVLQFSYDSRVTFREDLWMYEASATWAEEQVYPDIDDYLGYVPSFAGNSTVPLTGNTGDFLKIYGAAVWNHFLSETVDPAVVRDAWDMAPDVSPAHLSVAAYDSSLGGAGSSPFDEIGDQFAEFSRLTAEWRAEPTVFPDAEDLPRVRRIGKLRPSGRPRPLNLDHLAYALLNVRTDMPDPATLRVRAPGGTHFGLALVGRTGSATGGTVTQSSAVIDDGGVASLALPPGVYDRITAVVTNADARVNDARRYTRDDQRFKAQLVPGP